jgi:DNA-directed RNA polymerase omega subunit
MQDIDMGKLIKKVGSLYKLVILTSLRAVELSDGAAALSPDKPDCKTINAALKEIAEGKIEYKLKDKKE